MIRSKVLALGLAALATVATVAAPPASAATTHSPDRLSPTQTGRVLVGATPTAAPGTAVLGPGQRLVGGAVRYSPDRFVKLVLQGNGDLVISAGGRAIWSTHTGRHPHSTATLGRNGDLVISAPDGHPVFTTRVSSHADQLRLQDSGSLELYGRAGHRVWSSGSLAGSAVAGTRINAGQFLQSVTGERLIMQADGNLVLYRGVRALWSSRTAGHPRSWLLVRTDGNLVVYSPTSHTEWSSKTAGRGPHSRLIVPRGGNATLLAASGRAIWRAIRPIPPMAPSAPTAAMLASRLLQHWGTLVTGLPGVRADLVATRAGRAIQNSSSCGRAVRLDIRLLSVLDRMTAKYRIFINNMVSGHSCDSYQHPKGRATDLGGATVRATGQSTGFGSRRTPNNAAVDAAFVTDLGRVLPAGSGVGQEGCPGRAGVRLPAAISYFADSCTHQHFQLPSH